MKMRSDFVTNSSSTAFILIRKSELTPEGIARLLGIGGESVLKPVADALYYHIKSDAKKLGEYVNEVRDGAEDVAEVVRKEFSAEVAERVNRARAAGAHVEVGKFSSEGTEIETLFCTDSFEIENDEYYLNSLRSYW